MSTKPIIAFCGMTHLGLNSGVAGAEKGFTVIGYDPDVDLIAALNRGEPPVVEPDLEQLMAANAARLRFTTDLGALADADVVYVAPDVKTDDQGRSDLSDLEALLDRVTPVIRADAALVVLSQIPPGFARARPRMAGPLYYQVETLIFGRAIQRALEPERYILGCADPSAALHAGYKTFLGAHGCPILPMRYESAELAKIAINCCLVSSVSTANTLAALCETIGADWGEIVPALKLDRRIGPYAYLTPGLGIAGGNLERDLATVIRLGTANGTDVGVVQAWVENSRRRKRWAGETAAQLIAGRTDAQIGLLGLAYKENTHSTKNAPSLETLAMLPDAEIRAYDPAVGDLPAETRAVERVADALDAADDADVLIIMTPWPAFKTLEPADLAARMRGRTIVDPFAVLDNAACAAAGLLRLTLGVAPADAAI